jgi:hypothetical protein
MFYMLYLFNSLFNFFYKMSIRVKRENGMAISSTFDFILYWERALLILNCLRAPYYFISSLLQLTNADFPTLNTTMTIYYLIGQDLTEYLTAATLAKLFYDQAKDHLRKEQYEEKRNRGRNLAELLSTNVERR